MQKHKQHTEKWTDKRDKSQFDWVIRLILIYHFEPNEQKADEKKEKRKMEKMKTFFVLRKSRKLQEEDIKHEGDSKVHFFIFKPNLIHV